MKKPLWLVLIIFVVLSSSAYAFGNVSNCDNILPADMLACTDFDNGSLGHMTGGTVSNGGQAMNGYALNITQGGVSQLFNMNNAIGGIPSYPVTYEWDVWFATDTSQAAFWQLEDCSNNYDIKWDTRGAGKWAYFAGSWLDGANYLYGAAKWTRLRAVLVSNSQTSWYEYNNATNNWDIVKESINSIAGNRDDCIGTTNTNYEMWIDNIALCSGIECNVTSEVPTDTLTTNLISPADNDHDNSLSINFTYNVTSDESVSSNLSNGLIHVWDFAETSGKLIDKVGEANSSSVSVTSQNVDGINGNAWNCSKGTSDTIILDQNNIVNGSLSRTVVCWLRPEVANGAGDGRYFSYGSDRAFGWWDASIDNMKMTMVRYSGNIAGTLVVPQKKWVMAVTTFNGTHLKHYMNNTLDGTTAVALNTGGANQFRMCSDSAGTGEYSGSIDECMMWNRTLTATEVTELWNSGGGSFYPFSGGGGGGGASKIDSCSLYTDETGSWAVEEVAYNVPVNVTNHFLHTFAAGGNYTWNVGCTEATTSDFADSNRTLIIDTADPIETINPSNGFNSSNTSKINQYNNSELPVNITFADDNLLGFSINMTLAGVSYFNFTNISMNGETVKNYTTSIDVSTFPVGVFNIEVTSADSHTNSRIKDYLITKTGNQMTFYTDEGNEITISSWGAYKTNTEKNVDRYKFGFDYIFADTDRTFVIEATNKIMHIEESEYAAHFVVLNGMKGNWIDFEGIGKSYAVIKESDYKYRIVFTKIPVGKKLMLNSIGGLNVVTNNYAWYNGNYTTEYRDPASSGSVQDYVLNVSKANGYVDDVDATFEYNYTARSVVKATSANFITFTSSFTVPDEEITYNMTWDINITQNDSSIYGFTVNETQALQYAQINITLYDEENQSQITESGTVFLTLEQSITRTITGGSIVLGNLTLGEYYVQAETTNYPRRGVFVTITNQTQDLDLYLCVDETGNEYIDYVLMDNSQDSISDARLTYQKLINGSYITMAQYETDYAGQGRLFQDQQNEYRIIIDALSQGFNLLTIELFPLNTEYTIVLDRGNENFYSNAYEGIRYTLAPNEIVLNISQTPYDVFIDIYDDASSLEYFGVFINNHSYECNPASCISNITGSPSGGRATVTLKGNYTGTADVHYFFKRSGFDVQYIHGSFLSFISLEFLVGRTFAEILFDIRDEMGSNLMRAIFAVVVNTVLVVLAAQFGVAGIALVLVATIGNILFMIGGFISKFVGILLILVGVIMYVIMGRE